jgi:hypothetical protein
MAHAAVPWKWVAWGQAISINSQELLGLAFVNPKGNWDAGIPALGDVENAKFIVDAVNNFEEMLWMLERAEIWLGKMIADEGHLKSVAPKHCTDTLEVIEGILNRLDPKREVRKARD